MPKRNIEIGSANWASAGFTRPRPIMATQFEKRMRELRLTNENCARSDQLRRWCTENSHRCYIPEWLLKIWGIGVDTDFS